MEIIKNVKNNIKTVSNNMNEHFSLVKKHHPNFANKVDIVKDLFSLNGGSKNKRRYKKSGGSVNGPYAALMNKVTAYDRYGAPGPKYWVNGTNIQASSSRGPLVSCPKLKIGGKKQKKTKKNKKCKLVKLSKIKK